MAVRRKQESARWSVVEAKERLEAVIEESEARGPQAVARNSDDLVVIASVEEWKPVLREKGTLAEFLHNSPLRDTKGSILPDRSETTGRKGTLVEFLDNSPLKGLEVDFERHPDSTERDVDLW